MNSQDSFNPVTLTDPQDQFLRVKTDKVSQLLDAVSELGLVAAGVTHHPELAALELAGFENAVHQLEVLIREIQDLTSSLRLIPIDGVFKRMQRLVRDLSHQTGKPIELIMVGGATEIDKMLVDQLHDPLVHLIRNAADHGLESPQARLAAGKPEQGHITLSAAQQGGEIFITVADDGQGLNRPAILKRARAVGLAGPDEEPDDLTVWNFIFQPGFSTAQQISNISGRGVGMDVVQTVIRALRGHVFVESRPGQGTQVILRIPLTLAFLDSLIVRLGSRFFTIPIDVVNEIFKPENGQFVKASAHQSESIRVREDLIPICRLSQFYGENGSMSLAWSHQIMIVVETTRGRISLPMDEIIGQQQITLKPLQGHLKNIRAGAGYALMQSGEVAIALDIELLGQEFLK